MISRRRFIKQLLGLIALVAGGGTAVFQALKQEEFKAESGPEAAPAGQPEEAPSEKAVPEIPKEPLLSFFLLSDMHISVDDSTMTDKLHLALKDVSDFDSPVDTVILGGDLTDFGRESDYKLLRRIMDEYKLPKVYGNMGNHDYYDIWLNANGHFSTETMPNGKTDAMSRKRFQQFIGYKDLPYIDVWVNDVHLILVSQELYVQEKADVGEGAWYSDQQLDWLAETMKVHKDGRPAIVFIHQPLPEPGTDGGTHRLIRATRFREILEPYRNVFVLSGHTHRSFVGEDHYNTQNTFHWFNNASVGRTRGTSASGGASAQGMYVQVYPHQVVVRGREFTDRSWIDKAEWTVPLV
ncbi:metallophosphoesterase family protein [Paenibacillus allorhizosphaerae]|uniref:3',5'-cyclic adenosine monophosphate phosphodiesterase CpdA n=1 Tax=Paenibacillus allorhizosphaerae TaxID=2849866 RepID=A0ABM8VQQ7_9BACL|nr:metallophosphoesterase [Paenibacillus allorhizosphaerae]CAG7654492.1 3',5'-cyclic adenosine monophosphate phosphodiesterase CpdA [Paenibacillus allorhizosphaerae]